MDPSTRIAMVAKSLSTLAVATLVVLAGCSGFAPGAGDSPTAESPTADGGAEATPGDATSTGVVQFYVSDEKNAIGDFEHLNVTIEKVGFQRAEEDDEDEEETENATGTDVNVTETDVNVTETDVNATGTTETTAVNETTMTATGTPTANATSTATATATATVTTPTNATATNETATATANATATEGSEETEPEEDESEDDDEESGGWTEYDVENRTVDLTRLQGDNATLLSAFDVPEGSYTKAFVHVSEIDGTLENGETVNVKLPSEKLQLTKGFTVEANESIDFVFDITVFKAGNSGKYILKPVISESGTDVPIRDVDDEREDEERDEEQPEEMDRDDDELNASFVGTVEPGANATVRVTANGSTVTNATAYLDDEVVGATDDAGEVTFGVPGDGEEIEVTVKSGDAEAELEAEFESEEDDADAEDDENAEDDDRGNGESGDGSDQGQ